jgi:hypothetical protein
MPTPKINEKLHFVMPIYDGDGAVCAYVNAAPISREVFEAHFLMISKTFAAIHGEGLGDIAGPRVASLIMRRIAARGKDEESATSLMNEIRRMTNVSMSTKAGWEMVPFQEAMDKELINADDLAEVENALVFFTVILSMHQRPVAAEMLRGAAKLWGAQISSLDYSAFHASLKTSTKVETTGATPAPASSVVF